VCTRDAASWVRAGGRSVRVVVIEQLSNEPDPDNGLCDVAGATDKAARSAAGLGLSGDANRTP
jgi:hypothetical protein